MTGLDRPGSRVLLSHSESRRASCPLNSELVEADFGTARNSSASTPPPQRLVEEVIESRPIPAACRLPVELRREVEIRHRLAIRFPAHAPAGRRATCRSEERDPLCASAALPNFPIARPRAARSASTSARAAVSRGRSRAVLLFLIQPATTRSGSPATSISAYSRPSRGRGPPARDAGLPLCRLTVDEHRASPSHVPIVTALAAASGLLALAARMLPCRQKPRRVAPRP